MLHPNKYKNLKISAEAQNPITVAKNGIAQKSENKVEEGILDWTELTLDQFEKENYELLINCKDEQIFTAKTSQFNEWKSKMGTFWFECSGTVIKLTHSNKGLSKIYWTTSEIPEQLIDYFKEEDGKFILNSNQNGHVKQIN